MSKLTLTPAYGRDYSSNAEVIADWDKNKDFRISDISSPWDGKVINKQDAEDNNIQTVNIRYSKLTKICVLKSVKNIEEKTGKELANKDWRF